MTTWQVGEYLESVELEAPGGGSESWVSLVGTDGSETHLPLRVLMQAADHVGRLMLTHLEDRPSLFRGSYRPGLDGEPDEMQTQG